MKKVIFEFKMIVKMQSEPYLTMIKPVIEMTLVVMVLGVMVVLVVDKEAVIKIMIMMIPIRTTSKQKEEQRQNATDEYINNARHFNSLSKYKKKNNYHTCNGNA